METADPIQPPDPCIVKPKPTPPLPPKKKKNSKKERKKDRNKQTKNKTNKQTTKQQQQQQQQTSVYRTLLIFMAFVQILDTSIPPVFYKP